MTSIKSTRDNPLDEIDRLEVILRKYLPMLKAKKRSMIALHLSDIAGEVPHYEKWYSALARSEEISEDDLIECMEALEVSVLHMLSHMKDLKPLLGKAVNALPE
ncbi:MAG: hypothetical protein OXN17_18325 [Candidatus Poribacteria bacterium]|nr:hypothetical protein [Candidatus Poribacteria bacterium]MDE0502674.1 hypothetical protein [Candidatus Poribacteria bacterium]